MEHKVIIIPIVQDDMQDSGQILMMCLLWNPLENYCNLFVCFVFVQLQCEGHFSVNYPPVGRDGL